MAKSRRGERGFVLVFLRSAILIWNKLDMKLLLPGLNAQLQQLAIINMASGSLADVKFVQQARNIILQHSASPHVFDEQIVLDIPNHLMSSIFQTIQA